jgi:hypothetical protein
MNQAPIKNNLNIYNKVGLMNQTPTKGKTKSPQEKRVGLMNQAPTKTKQILTNISPILKNIQRWA